MSTQVLKLSDCQIIKHQEAILDTKAFAQAYSVLEDLVLRCKQRKVICDLTSIRDCKLSRADFIEMKGAMFHIFMNAPENFHLAIASNSAALNKNIEACHVEIRQAGYLHDAFITSSLDDAISKLGKSKIN